MSLFGINKHVTNTETYGCVLAGTSECWRAEIVSAISVPVWWLPLQRHFYVSHFWLKVTLLCHMLAHAGPCANMWHNTLKIFLSISAITHVLPTRIHLIVLVLAFSAMCSANYNRDQIWVQRVDEEDKTTNEAHKVIFEVTGQCWAVTEPLQGGVMTVWTTRGSK